MHKTLAIYSVLFGLLAAEAFAGQAWAGNILTFALWALILLFLLFSVLYLAIWSCGIKDFPKIEKPRRSVVKTAIFYGFLICLAAAGHIFTAIALLVSTLWCRGLVHLADGFKSEQSNA